MDTNQNRVEHPLAGKHIIVAGAGIAGLAFVRSLTLNWPQDAQRPHVTVYERDPRQLPADRGNYSLGLRSDSRSGGLQALKKLGLIDQIYASRAPGSVEGIMIRNAKWETMMKQYPSTTAAGNGLPIAKMRITRNELREVLIQGVSDDVAMRWEVGCNTAAQLKDGRMEVGLSDGTTEECDLLIVADGASSKLRGCLRPDDKLNFTGAVMMGGNAVFQDGNIPQRLLEGFGVVIGGDGHSLVIFRIDDNSFVWFLTRLSDTPRPTLKGARAVEMQDQIIAEALSEGEVFGEPFRALVTATDPTSLKTFNAQDKMPISHSETPGLPCIFIGDSNHAMSPFSGNGANMAIMDGAVLGGFLCTSSSTPSAVDAFDKESMPRCRKAINMSHIIIDLTHATGWKLWFATLLVRFLNYFFFRG